LAHADLYLERIDFRRYLQHEACDQCGFSSCDKFIEAIKQGIKKPRDCSFVSNNKAYAVEAIQTIKDLWPEVPLLTHPRPGFIGLVELNKPSPESFVLVTGNNEYTEEVLLTVLGTTICPFHVLFVNTDGNTVDMSMIYKTLTAERINSAMKESGISGKAGAMELMIPGLAFSLKEDIEQLTGWSVKVGPVCAAELPLFLSEIWVPPKK
jgi:CO dehydrogenase/acetyl-CoA synthase gamma subunit (corrinoid Fe-S protein)